MLVDRGAPFVDTPVAAYPLAAGRSAAHPAGPAGYAGRMDDVERYLAQFAGETRSRLDTVRQFVRDRCPRAVESLSYGLIGYTLNGRPLLYVGGFARHLGLYATPAGHEAFAADFAPYARGEGSVQFPLTQPLPVDLIARVIDHRVAEVSDQLPPLGGPATRALAAIGVTRASDVAVHSAAELLALHGVGPKAIRLLRDAGVRLRDD